MSFLIDASAVYHSGALTHHLGMLPALADIAGREPIRILASPELGRALQSHSLSALDVRIVSVGHAATRLLGLDSQIRRQVRSFSPGAASYTQYAPVRTPIPYLLRVTDAHHIDREERRRLMRFYSPAERIGWQAKLIAFRSAVRRASGVLCATRSARDQLLESYPGLARETVRVAPYGLSPLAQVEERHPGPSRRRLLTMHLSPRKGVEDILEAMAEPGMEQYELTVLGDLDAPTNRYTRFLDERARALGIRSRIRSAGYLADPSRLRQVLFGHDALVVPSRIESWSHTVVEGMALGIPVVASDIPCHREVSGGAASLVPVRSPRALAKAIREAVAGGAQTRARLDRGVEVARTHEWRGYATALLESLRAISV